ncbi:hypothetical protein BDV93DRAFT_506423 [Ceratobasidium sp. AG-I]|nr:hypothetical protein BDV93DRAFT_506423 [Ceratobasidium sp. AG-I]
MCTCTKGDESKVPLSCMAGLYTQNCIRAEWLGAIQDRKQMKSSTKTYETDEKKIKSPDANRWLQTTSLDADGTSKHIRNKTFETKPVQEFRQYQLYHVYVIGVCIHNCSGHLGNLLVCRLLSAILDLVVDIWTVPVTGVVTQFVLLSSSKYLDWDVYTRELVKYGPIVVVGLE